MIHLTRLNNHPLAVNSDLIKFVEQAPDTVLTLLNGEKVIVRESTSEVLNRILEFRRSILRGLFNINGMSTPHAPTTGETSGTPQG